MTLKPGDVLPVSVQTGSNICEQQTKIKAVSRSHLNLFTVRAH